MSIIAKICGLTTDDAVHAAIAGGAEYIGFVFYPPSPRNVSAEKAKALAALAPASIKKVAVTVNPDDALLHEILSFAPDYVQLHGSESPERVGETRKILGKTGIIKAINVKSSDDVAGAHAFETVADMLLFDARVSGGLPGGNGLAFDWMMLAGRSFAKPWFLSGGLNADNVEEAIRVSGARLVDVSSSVESKPGLKDPKLIAEFMQKVKSIRL